MLFVQRVSISNGLRESVNTHAALGAQSRHCGFLAGMGDLTVQLTVLLTPKLWDALWFSAFSVLTRSTPLYKVGGGIPHSSLKEL